MRFETRWTFSLVAVSLAFCCLFFSGTSFAQEKPIKLDTTKGIYYEGAQFFHQKKYEEAAVRFQIAHKLLPKGKKYDRARQKLTYYLGMSYYHTKKYKLSDKYLAEYLLSPLDQEKAAEVRKIHNEVKRYVAAMPKERKAEPIKKIVYIKQKPKVIIQKEFVVKKVIVRDLKPKIRPLPFIIATVGTLALVGAVITGGIASQKETARDKKYQSLASKESRSSQEVATLHKSAQNLAMISNTLYATGAATAITGLVFIFTSGWTTPKASSTQEQSVSTRSNLQPSKHLVGMIQEHLHETQ